MDRADAACCGISDIGTKKPAVPKCETVFLIFFDMQDRYNMSRRISVVVSVMLLCAASMSAQKAERKNIRSGNKQYEKENYTEAEINYRKGIEVNPRSVEGGFNLGNALFKQEKYPEAAEQYQLVAGQGERLLQEDPEKNVDRLAEVFHNIGNIGMKTQEYQKSVEAYKQALRLNPTDEETRYNLALAQKLLQDQEQQEQEQDDQSQDRNEDQQEQEQKQDRNQDQQDQNRQDQKQDQEQEQKTQEEEQQNEQMSRDNAQQILDAFLQDEKDTQEKVKKAQMQQQQSRKKEKEW
jgi:tetratricopeptide (TPR) repeat protein